MGKSGHLRLEDVRAALRLVGECRDLRYDPGLWAPHMLAGLCRLVGAPVGNGGEVRQVRPDGPLEGVAYFDTGFAATQRALYTDFLSIHGVARHPFAIGFSEWRAAGLRAGQVSTMTRRQAVADRAWYRSICYNECHRVMGIDHCLGSVWEFASGGLFHAMMLHRAAGEPDFSERQRRVLHLFHAELGPLIGPVLVTASDPCSPTRLPPRVREVLDCLLEGDGEKQVAARLGLSRPTVHQYVTALYRRYAVTSRAELLARFIRRGREETR